MVNKFSFDSQPRLRLLSDEQIKIVHEKALITLETTGVKFDSKEALNILQENGATIDFDQQVAKIPPSMVIDAINRAPAYIQLYDREGNPAANLGGNNLYFDPGSAAIKFLESDGETVRPTQSGDLVNLARLVDGLEHIELLSTALVLYDVPMEVGDAYRVYLLLKNSSKPMIAGSFSVEGIGRIQRLLAAAVGGGEELRAKPRAVIDICSSAPLKWTHISCQNIIDCARLGLPIETISVPLPGACSPATLAGSVLIHTVEALSGLVLAQCINPGHPVVYGGAPMNFDMRFNTTSLSALEATMMAACYAQMGKYYALPTHTYACLSDSKSVDAQAGLETAMSGILASLAGVNVISGPGILDFCTVLSLEKLVIDHEICGMSKRLVKGINFTEETVACDLICELGPGGDYLSSDHTFRWFKEESFYPSQVIERRNRDTWEKLGKKTMQNKAVEKVRDILANHHLNPLCAERAHNLDNAMLAIMTELNITDLPHFAL